MNTKNVHNGPELVIAQQIQISCFFIVENPVEHVDSNHVSYGNTGSGVFKQGVQN